MRRADSAPVVANLTLFPLLFVSGVFYSVQNEPGWLRRIADVFPLSHLIQAFTACFSPYTTGTGFSGRDLLSLLVLGMPRHDRGGAAARPGGDRRATEPCGLAPPEPHDRARRRAKAPAVGPAPGRRRAATRRRSGSERLRT